MISTRFPIILASKSPRRRELFHFITPEFTCAVSDFDEHGVHIQSAPVLCRALAKQKAEIVFADHPDSTVVGCDTVVALDDQILGKPHNRAEARQMLQQLSGRWHIVYTGVHVCSPVSAAGFVCRSAVDFYPLTAKDVEAYVATEEPYDKAGGYGIQGSAARFVRGIRGDYFNVMGLPVSRLYRLLRQLQLLDASDG